MNIQTKQNKRILPDSPFVWRAEELNQITEELQNVIRTAGLMPDANNITQLKEALDILYGTGSDLIIVEVIGSTASIFVEAGKSYSVNGTISILNLNNYVEDNKEIYVKFIPASGFILAVNASYVNKDKSITFNEGEPYEINIRNGIMRVG